MSRNRSFELSDDERQKAVDLIEGEVETWNRLQRMRLTTEAEREMFARNASILTRVADGLS